MSPHRNIHFQDENLALSRGTVAPVEGYNQPVMILRLSVGIASLVCMSASGLAGSLLWFKMLDQVNERLPAAEQIGYLAWWFPKSLRLVREYSRLYPNGKLLKKQWTLFALAFGCLFVSAWCFGFFRQ